MEYLQQILKIFLPSPIHCSEFIDAEEIMDPMNSMEDFVYEAQTKNFKKVPMFEHLFTSVYSVTSNTEFIKGFRFDFSIPLSQKFSVGHQWLIPNSGSPQVRVGHPMMAPTSSKPTYTMTTQYVTDIQGQQPNKIMMGKFDNEGKVDAIYLQKLAQNLKLKVQSSFSNKNVQLGAVVCDLEYQDKDTAGVLRLGNFNWGINYMQRIYKNLILGFDYANVPMQRLSGFSYGGKLSLKNHAFLAQYSLLNDQLNLGYLASINKNTSFISHYKYEGKRAKPTTIVGIKQRYNTYEVIATINSRLKITTQFTLKGPLYSVKLCAQADYNKEDYSFGYGIVIGQQ